MKVLVVIPARGGSKGIPKKNIKELGGKPLISHTIECAIASKLVTQIVVTTDADDIMSVAESYPITTIKRPAELSDDYSNVVDAAMHAYQMLDENFDVLILLQPTAPFRTTKDLDEVIKMFEDVDLEGVISVVPMNEIHPARMYELDSQSKMSSLLPNGESLRRQDIKPVYYRNGCFYAVRVDAFLKQKKFMVENKKAYIMNPEWLINIDTPRDFMLAQLLFNEWKNQNY